MPDPKYSYSGASGATKRTTIKDLEAMHPGIKYSSGKIGSGPVIFKYKDETGNEYGYEYTIDDKGMSQLVSTGPLSKPAVTTAPKINQVIPPVEKKPVTINPIVNETPRKPIVFGNAGYTDPNTGQTFSYDAAYKQKEIEPNVQNYKKGGIVGKIRKYAEGGSTGSSDMSQEEGSALATQGIGMVGGLANQWATKQELEAASQNGTVNDSAYRNAGIARGAAQGAEMGAIGLNPALLTATGGLSALAVPAGAIIGGSIGGVTGKKKGEKINQEIEDQKRDEEAQKQAGIAKQNLAKAYVAREQGLKEGGMVKGPGTAKSDSISAKVKPGSFVVPAENADKAEAVRKTVLKAPSVKKKANLNQDGGEKVKLSNGEHLFTPEERQEIIQELGEEFLEMLAPNAEDKDEMAEGGLTSSKARKILHDGSVRGNQLTDKQRKYMGAIASGYKCGGKVKGYKDGTTTEGVEEETITEKLLNKNKPVKKTEVKKTTVKTAPKTGKKEVKETNNLTVEQMKAMGPEISKTLANKSTGTLDLKKEQISQGTPIETKAAKASSKETSPKKESKGVSKALLKEGMGLIGKASNYALPYYQTQQGLKFLAGAGKRPVDQIDQEYLTALERAKTQAEFGYTGAEQALIDQKNLAGLRAGESAARLYSGGSGANAYAMQRQAANDYVGRGLEAMVKGKQLQMSKQQYADQLGTQKAEMSRRLFQDNLNAWNQKQQSGAELVGAGLTNAVAAKRYNDELSFLNELRGSQNNWMNNITG
jgi:hypothetical protein